MKPASLLRAAILVVALGLFSGVVSTNAVANVVFVGNCNPSGVHFPHIQDAINAAPAAPGYVIKICPGTYNEQLLITQSLTLQGISSGQKDGVVIAPPVSGLGQNATSFNGSSTPIAAHVFVSGTGSVNMSNIIVDSFGNNINSCAPELVGIFYQNSSGTLSHVVTRNQWVGASESDPNFNGCQTGLGIFVQSGNSLTSTLTVTNSSVHDYQKNGITGNETGTKLTVTNSEVIGQGPTTGAAENGIQIGFSAAGTISGNFVTNDIYSPASVGASGILLFDALAGGVSVKTNTVGSTQLGIALANDTAGQDDNESVLSNKVFATVNFDGIDVCTNGNTIQTNTVSNSAESDIHLDASCGATGNNNTVTGNILSDTLTGLLKDAGVSGNSVSPNTFFTSTTADPAGTARPHTIASAARP